MNLQIPSPGQIHIVRVLFNGPEKAEKADFHDLQPLSQPEEHHTCYGRTVQYFSTNAWITFLQGKTSQESFTRLAQHCARYSYEKPVYKLCQTCIDFVQVFSYPVHVLLIVYTPF
jgi:hypothetical protein